MSRSGPRGWHHGILKSKDTAQQADIQNKQLKGFQILISLQGQTCSIYTADLIDKAAVGQSQDSGLVFLGASAVTNQTVKELFVFLCQLGGNAVPQHTQLWNDLMGRMLGKVLLICSKDSLLDGADFGKVVVIGKALHGFRHTADEVVELQNIYISLPEAGYHRKIAAVQKLCKEFLSSRHQKLFKGERIQLQKIHLAGREGCTLVECDP